MKTLRNFILVCIGFMMAATVFTACNDNNEDNTTLSKEECYRRLQLMSGLHQGKLHIFFRGSDKIESDSLNASFTIDTDSVMAVNMPAKLLTYAINGDSNPDLEEALKAAGTVTAKFKLFLHNNASEGYGFLLVPMSDLKFTCAHGEKTFDISIKFAVYNNYFDNQSVTAAGIYNLTTSRYLTYIPVYTITVNGSPNLMNALPLAVSGK